MWYCENAYSRDGMFKKEIDEVSCSWKDVNGNCFRGRHVDEKCPFLTKYPGKTRKKLKKA